MGDFAFEGQVKKLIPAEVRMISGCADSQTSADVSNVNQFKLPDPAGRSGGACTSALLKVLYAEHQAPSENLSWVEVLLRMREILAHGSYTQVPQLTSSRPMDVSDSFHIVPPGSYGARRAVLIGINYEGQEGQLSGCHNDVKNIKEYLMNVHGFQDRDIVVLMDDGYHRAPTKHAIMNAFQELVYASQAGDVAFVHYSGHGGFLPDDNGDEEDGYDETLIPVDFQRVGQIRDDDIYKVLVGAMPEGVTLTCLMDCCHSGTVLDLPYRFVGDGDHFEMVKDERVNMNAFEGMELLLFAGAAACCLQDILSCFFSILFSD